MKVNFSDKTVTFTKNNNNKYTISFTLLPGDQLYPCVLFYYINDEVEFLPNHKFWVICDMFKNSTASFSISLWGRPRSSRLHCRRGRPEGHPHFPSKSAAFGRLIPSRGSSPGELWSLAPLQPGKQLPTPSTFHCIPIFESGGSFKGWRKQEIWTSSSSLLRGGAYLFQ